MGSTGYIGYSGNTGITGIAGAGRNANTHLTIGAESSGAFHAGSDVQIYSSIVSEALAEANALGSVIASGGAGSNILNSRMYK